MNILVTGANGFIGRHVCESLENDGHNVVRLVRKNDNKRNNYLECDLTDPVGLEKILLDFARDHSVDFVIHLASVMASQQQDKAAQFKTLIDNIEMTRSVVMISDILNPKKVINLSSMAVYPNVDGIFNEESKVSMSANSDCMYGLSKYCSENILSSMLKNKNILISHLRLAQVYGEGMREDRIMPIMKSELKKENVITVFGDGQRMSAFIHISKLVEILKYFIREPIEGIYNVGSESLSFLQLAQRMIAEEGNEYSKIIRKETGLKSKFILDISKLEKMIDDIRKTRTL